MAERVSEQEMQHCCDDASADPPTGRGSIIPALARDLRDARAEIAALLTERRKLVEAAVREIATIAIGRFPETWNMDSLVDRVLAAFDAEKGARE